MILHRGQISTSLGTTMKVLLFSAVWRVCCECSCSRMTMVRSLLHPYENRAWAQSNWILVRIWQGCGFAFRYHKSPHLLKKLGPKLLCVDSSLTRQSIRMCYCIYVADQSVTVLLKHKTVFCILLKNQPLLNMSCVENFDVKVKQSP
jgi:hypothetical protein